MPSSTKKRPDPDVYTLMHSAEYGWQGMHSTLSEIPAWKVECDDPDVQANLQTFQDANPSYFVPGIQNNPPFSTYEGIIGSTQTTRWFPDMYHGGVATGLANVLAAMFALQTAANGLHEVTGRCNLIYAYSGGCQTTISSAIAGQLSAKTVHMFGPVLPAGDLESISAFDNIYIHRGTHDWIGWLGFLELRLESIPDGMGGSMPGFTITIHSNGGSGRVKRDSWPYDHSGSNGIREHIKYILDHYTP